MRIVRFTVPGTSSDQGPQYGALTGDLDEYGQPAEDAVIVALAGDPLYAGVHILEQTYPLSAVGLLAPVIPRSKVVAIGKNYADHAAEMGGEVPAEPLIFLKPNTAVIGPGDGIVYPTQSENVHYEGELAIVISRICRDVPRERAAEVIYGFTLANDVTARDLQKRDGQFTRAKGFDTFCPLGPWIETELPLEAIKDGIAIQTYLDGDLVQDGSTKDLMFDVPAIIEAVTSVMTLLPGDVILTGTPSGVGPMTVGQEVEVASPLLGALMNTVVAKK